MQPINLFHCFVVIWLSLWLVGCGESPRQQAREQERKQEEQLEAKKSQTIAELRQAYDADDTWQQSFKRVPIWTMDVRDRLVRADGRPILSTGILHDVERQGKGYILHFTQGYWGMFEIPVDIDFILECSLPEEKREEVKEPRDYIMALPTFSIAHNYAFVARIHAVKNSDRLIANVTEGQSAEIQVDSFPHFIATGECLALKYIGE